MRNQPAFFSGLILAAGGLLGCSSDPQALGGSGGSSGDSISIEQEELTTCSCDDSSYTTYEISTVMDGPTRSGHVCWPTRYDRHPDNGSTVLWVVPDDDPNYYFAGLGQATCLKRCCFKSNGGDQDVRWLSETWYVSHGTGNQESHVAKAEMWQSDAMQFLGSIDTYSRAMGNADRAWVSASNTDPWAPAYVNSKVFGPDEAMLASGFSFFVGIPQSGHIVRKLQGTLTNPTNTIDLGMTSTHGICTVSELEEARANSEPSVTLRRSNGRWKMQPGPSVGTISTTCYYFDQSQ